MSVTEQLLRALPEGIVITGDENTRPFECDGLSVYRQKPLAVALPENIDQIKQVLRICKANNTPVVTRGAGTGLAGGATPLEQSVVLGLSKLKKIKSIDTDKRLAVVEPGVRNLAISEAVAEYGLYYAPDPSSQIACSIGGNVAENSGGVHCLKYGLTVHNVESVTILTINGETLTLSLNNPKLSPKLWSSIQTKNLNDILKPKVVGNRYASVKITNIVNPVVKSFSEVKDEITPIYKKDAEKEALMLLSEERLTDIDNLEMNVSTFITLDNAQKQNIGLNAQETSNFVSKLFTSQEEKGIIPIGSKVLVYKIMEQKLIPLESNETNIMQNNADKVKDKSFQAALMKALDKKYPTKLY